MSEPGPAPGWYPDPSQPLRLRFWDGHGWTTHTLPAPPDPPNLVAAERRAVGWARWGFVAWAICQAAGLALSIANVPNLDPADQADPNRIDLGNPALFVGANVASLLGLAALALVAVWTYRACVAARGLGLATRRAPGWAAASYFLPILNLWWPYQSVRDCLPPDDLRRAGVGRWWGIYIGSLAASLLALVGVLDAGLAALFVALAVLLAGIAAMLGRDVVADVTASHEELAARHRARDSWQ